MGNGLKVAALAVLIVVASLLALMLSGVWPGPSAADRQRSSELFAAAGSQMQSGDQDSALRSLNDSIRLAPQNEALRMRSSIYLARNDFDGAQRDLDQLIGRAGGVAADYSLRCWLRARGDALRDARHDCDRAIAMDPSLANAFGNRGLVGLRQGRHDEAWEDFNTALRVGGDGEGVAWRVFGRGVASWGRGDAVEGRADVELALHSTPAVAAEFAQFGVGGEIIREFDNATYVAAVNPRSLISLRQYLVVYPGGAHVAEAHAQIAEIYAWIAEDEAAGRQTIPGFSFAHSRGSAPASDSFGAIAISRSTWRVAFVTDYATGAEAEHAAVNVCNTASVRDCEAFNFRNVCAALAISPPDRVRQLAWEYGEDEAVRTAISGCRHKGGSHCVPVHSQCTPTPPTGASTPAAP